MAYEWIRDKQHTITVRDRETGFAKQRKVWNKKVIEQVLSAQKDTEDVFITKYPKDRLVETVILDFDSKDEPRLAFNEANRLRNFLKQKNINSVIVESGSKGNHLYIEIAPFKFKDTELRKMSNWSSYFNAFVCFLISDSDATYETLDETNFNASLNGNIRLLGSKHPSTGKVCRIIKGSFNLDTLPTTWQDEAQKKACLKMEITAQDEKRKALKKTKVIGGNDPIEVNDLRDVFREITGDIKLYPKGYGYCSCPVHGTDSHFSLLVTRKWFSCSACSFKGNIWTLRKMGLVEFDGDGIAKL